MQQRLGGPTASPPSRGGGVSGGVACLRSQPRRTRLAPRCSGIIKCSLQVKKCKPQAKRARQHRKLSGDHQVCPDARRGHPPLSLSILLSRREKKNRWALQGEEEYGRCRRAARGHEHVRCLPLRQCCCARHRFTVVTSPMRCLRSSSDDTVASSSDLGRHYSATELSFLSKSHVGNDFQMKS